MWISVCLLPCFKIPLIFSSIFFCFIVIWGNGIQDFVHVSRVSITKRPFKFFAPKFFNRLYQRYPAYLPVLQRAIERWYGEPACTTPILKLLAELMQNR